MSGFNFEPGNVAAKTEDGLYAVLYCPGCKEYHCPNIVDILNKDTGELYALAWQFNHDLVKPTLSPSLLVKSGKGFTHICHSFITDGQIRYLEDCTHDLRGQTVDLTPPPEGF